jgi:hypothetical protein
MIGVTMKMRKPLVDGKNQLETFEVIEGYTYFQHPKFIKKLKKIFLVFFGILIDQCVFWCDDLVVFCFAFHPF